MPRRFVTRGQGRSALPAHARPFRTGASLREIALVGVVCAIVLVVIAPAAAHAQNEQWQVGTASSFSSGRYDTDSRTTVLYTPITARRLFADGDVTLVFPLTCIKGNGSVTVVSGSPVRNERGTNAVTTSRIGTTGRTGTTVGPPVTTCGMGDIVVRSRYYLVDEGAWSPTIAVLAHLKAPTASADRGLGTGRPDEGIGVEVSRGLSRGVVAMLDGGYTLIGAPTDVRYQNTWWYDAGVSQDLANGAVNLSVFFEEYRAILPGSANARDILASVMLKGAAGWRIQVSGQFGLSDGAPDHGLTFGASRRF